MPDVKGLKACRHENMSFKNLLEDQVLETDVIKDALGRGDPTWRPNARMHMFG